MLQRAWLFKRRLEVRRPFSLLAANVSDAFSRAQYRAATLDEILEKLHKDGSFREINVRSGQPALAWKPASKSGATNFARFPAPDALAPPSFLFNRAPDTERTDPLPSWNFFKMNLFIGPFGLLSAGAPPLVDTVFFRLYRVASVTSLRLVEKTASAKNAAFCASHGANESLLSCLEVFPLRSSSCCPPR